MATITLLQPQSGAQATDIPFDTAAYQSVVVSADNLATTETVTIHEAITTPANGTVYVPATNSSGAAASLTATLPSCILTGGRTYSFVKSATAGACGVYLTPTGRVW